MRIEILSRARLERWINYGWLIARNPLIISLSSAGVPPIQLEGFSEGRILSLTFETSSVEQHKCTISDQDAYAISSFILCNRKSNYLIVSCPVGTICAAGVAAAIEEYLHGDAKWVFKEPEYNPNMDCYRKVKKAFGEETI